VLLDYAGGGTLYGTCRVLREPRGFCLTVRELNDALLLLTIEGLPGNIEIQAWLSTFSLQPSQVDAYASK